MLDICGSRGKDVRRLLVEQPRRLIGFRGSVERAASLSSLRLDAAVQDLSASHAADEAGDGAGAGKREGVRCLWNETASVVMEQLGDGNFDGDRDGWQEDIVKRFKSPRGLIGLDGIIPRPVRLASWPLGERSARACGSGLTLGFPSESGFMRAPALNLGLAEVSRVSALASAVWRLRGVRVRDPIDAGCEEEEARADPNECRIYPSQTPFLRALSTQKCRGSGVLNVLQESRRRGR